MSNKDRFLTKLRNLWFDSIKLNTDVLVQYKGSKQRFPVILKDALHKKVLLNTGNDQNMWFRIEDCQPVPGYMDTEIYKALNGEK
jgi:hypothetical protein